MTLKPIDKIWGTTTPLIMTPMFELHRLRIKPWVRCSWHLHNAKVNLFYVLGGSLFVDHGSPACATAHIRAGETFIVSPGIEHQFRTGDGPCTALEMYYTEPLSEDIIRRNVGSVLERHR